MSGTGLTSEVLALANPATQDTKTITLDGTEWHASRAGWTKEVQQNYPGLPQADDFGRPTAVSETAEHQNGFSFLWQIDCWLCLAAPRENDAAKLSINQSKVCTHF